MNNIFWPKDENGYLKDLSAWENVDQRYKSVIEDVKNSYLNNIAINNIISIYVIGSIVTGKAKYGISDIDSFVLVKDDDLESEWIEAESKIVSNKNECVSKVGFKIVLYENVLKLNDIFKAFLISTQGLCIYGDDIKPKLPKFKPDKEIALSKVIKFKKYMTQARHEILEEKDIEKIKVLCRKYNKVILRTSGLLVIEHTHEYSNDASTCLRLFTKYYPEYETVLNKCLDLVENPIADKIAVIQHLETINKKFKPLIYNFLETDNKL
jgi:hypothetical protein